MAQTVYSSIDCVYTDGACSGNPGPGGWGTVVYFKDGSVHELGGAAAETTNNRMELQAAIAALDFLACVDQSTPVTLHTDSQYVKNGITQWIRGWKRKGWKTASGKAVLNKDLWEKLDALNSAIKDQLPLEWKYVKGHSGNVGNDRCDQIARAFSTGTPIQLKQAERSVSSTTATKKNTPSASPSSPQLKQTELVPELAKVGTDDSGDSLVLPIALMSKATSSDQDMTIQSRGTSEHSDSPDPVMADSRSESSTEAADLPRDVAVAQLRHVVETLHMADEVASQGYLITSSELAALMDIHASAVTSRGNNWVWRNWMVSRVRREGNQILWQLERID